MKFEKSKLSDLCTVITDGSHTSPKATGDGYKMLSVKDMEYLDFNYDNAKLISQPDYDNLVKNGCKPLKNDVLIAKDGNSCLESCFVMRQEKDVVLLSSIAILRPNLEKINPFYLMYVLKSPSIKNDLKKNHVSGSAIPRMILKDFREYEITYPSLEYQNKIVDFLYSIDLKIEINKKIIKKLEELTFHFFKHWFIDFEFPNEEGQPYKSSGEKMVESELGMIPEGWSVQKFKEMYSNYDRMRIPLSKREREKREEIYPYYGAASQMDYVDDYIFDGTYLLLGEDGTVINGDGSPVLQYVWGKFWVNNHAHVLKGTNPYSTEYLFLLLKHTNVESIITGAVQKKISQSNLNSLNMIKPTDDIVAYFSKFIEPSFNAIKSRKDENILLSRLKDILLPKLLSGEIEVPVKEPESV